MFARFALAVGRGAHRQTLVERARAAGLPCLSQTDYLMLAVARDTPFLIGNRAVLVGQLFSSEHQRLAELPIELDRLVDADLPMQGRWGNFLLISCDGGRARSYREPSGSVSAFRCGSPDMTIFVSDAGVASRLGLLDHAEPDLRFAVHWLQFPFLRTRRTGIVGVEEQLAGVVATTEPGAGWVERAGWRPQSHIGRTCAIQDAEVAAVQLRKLATEVVPAQADRRVLLRLSGGLDSSLIAACFAAHGDSPAAVNFSTRSLDGDERSYARDVADRCGLQLREVAESPPALLEVDRAPSFAPTLNPLLAPFDRAISEALCEEDALMVDGAGGDNLFCSLTSAAPALDALLAGNGSSAFRTVGDIAERAGCTLWEVAAAARRRAFRSRPPWKEDQTFLRPEAMLPAADEHPWLSGLRAPPGKREHVEALVHIQHFLDRSHVSRPLLHPLLCQPLLELCLRIPTWLWVRGGRDRAVARDAFENLLPASVIARRTKGSLQSMFDRSFAALAPQMLDLLRSGALVSAGIIDPGAIEGAFSGNAWRQDDVQLRLSEMTAVELWLRSWAVRPWRSSEP